MVENKRREIFECENGFSVLSTPKSLSEGTVESNNRITHLNVKCDECCCPSIVGVRYKCAVCPNFDICQ